MKQKRFTEEQIISILRTHVNGMSAAELAIQHGLSESILYTWRVNYGDIEISDAKRLRELEAQNAKLIRHRVLMLPPTQVNQRSSIGFISGQLVNVRILGCSTSSTTSAGSV